MPASKAKKKSSPSGKRGQKYWKKRAIFLEKVLHAIPDMILVKGSNSKLVWANNAFQKLYQMNNNQLRDLIDSPVNEPDFTQQYLQDDLWVWVNQKELRISCEPVTRFDGSIRRLETYKTPIIAKNRSTIFTVGISRDITEKIDLDERTETASKMAELGVMAGGIAHEINNPLAVVIGKTRLCIELLNNSSPLVKEKLLHNLSQIFSSGERIMKIVSGLISFSREGGNDPYTRVGVGQIIEDTLSFCRSRLSHEGISLSVETIGEDLEVDCRPTNLSKILLNLLNNAFDAVQGKKNPWIRISARRVGAFLELRVWDSGEGVLPTIEVKILQPFFTTKEKGSGTGLGLSISSRLARDHGGTLRLDRAVAASCFLLRIPLVQKKTTLEKEAA